MIKSSSSLKKLTITILGVCLYVTVSLGQTCVENLPFQHGEEITYIIYYNWGFLWVPAGEVRFKVEEQEAHLQYEVTGKTFSSYESMFKVRDYYMSKVDKATLEPVSFRRNIHEGNYVRYDSISFDQNNHHLQEYFGKTKESAKLHEFQLDKVVQDMVSVIYKLRTSRVKELAQGDNIPFSIFFDKELFDLNVKYQGLKKTKIKDLGKKYVHHFQPGLIDGYVFSEEDIMDVFVSNDANQVPLMIESPISVGSVKAVLSSTKGLKHEADYLPDGYFGGR